MHEAPGSHPAGGYSLISLFNNRRYNPQVDSPSVPSRPHLFSASVGGVVSVAPA